MPRRLRARAFAKINLGLKIVGRRPDGFHELRTVFQTISLADSIEITLAQGSGLRLEATGLTAGLPAESANLALRAAEAARDAWRLPGQIAVRLDKQIPLRAGLGGGSADAAAVLRLLAEAAPRKPAPVAVHALARQLGADVPALLVGGTVLGLGRGDEVYPLADLAPWPCLLAMPLHAQVSTPAAFAAWDRDHPGNLTSAAASATIMEFCSLVDQVLPAFRRPFKVARNRGTRSSTRAPKVHAGIENDFQAGVFSLSPDFPRIHQQLWRASAAWVSLTGSGAAQFGLFRQANAAAQAWPQLRERYPSWRARLVSRAEVQRNLQT